MKDEVKDMKSMKMMLTGKLLMRLIMMIMMMIIMMSVRRKIYNKSDV